MNIQKLFNRAHMIRVGGNAHRFICRINGKLRSITTHEKDFDSNLASLFSNLNAFSMTPKAATSLALASMMALSSLAAWAEPVNPLPTGGTWQGGSSGSISTVDKTMNVNTGNNRSAIRWNTFDIGTGYTVNFNLPSSQAAILNRVTGGNPSEILGALNSNGRVYLINPNGILFGATASVNVASLFASTLRMAPGSFTNFMAGGNTLSFEKPGNAPPAAVKNQGTINITDTSEKGFAVLAGGAVENAGTINAPNSYVTLAAAQKVTLQLDPMIGARVTLDKALKSNLATYQNAVNNTLNGVIKADGGLVQLQARLETDLYTRAVNNSGRIEANTLAFNDKGQVELLAYGNGNSSNIRNIGTVETTGDLVIDATKDVRNTGTLQASGDIHIEGRKLTNEGLVRSTDGDITGVASGEIINTGEIRAASNIDLTAETDITNSNGAIIRTANGSINLESANGNINNQGTIRSWGALSGVNLIAHNGGVLTNNLVASQFGNVNLAAGNGNLVNSGTVRAWNGDINLYASNNVENYWSVDARNGDLNIYAGNNVYNDNSAELLATDNVTIGAGNNIVNNGTIDPVSVTLTAGQDIVNNGLIEGDYILLDAGRDIRNSGQVGTNATSAVALLAGRDLRVLGSGKVSGNHIYNYAARDIINAGQIGNWSTTGLYQVAERDINNNGSMIGNSVLAIAGRNLNNTGWIWGYDIVAAALRNLNNWGDITAINNVLVAANRDLNNYNYISAGNQLLGFTTRDINNYGTMTGGLNSLHAFRNLNNFSGGFIGGTYVYAQAENNVNVAGLIGDSNTLLASVNAGNDVNVTSTETGDCCDPNGPTANQAGRIFGDTVEVYAGNDVNVDGYVGDGRANSVTNVTANNNIQGRGLFSGHEVNLRSLNGNIGSGAQRVRTAANFLSLNAPNGSVFVNQLGSVILQDSAAANTFALKVFKACNAPEGTKAHLTIEGDVSGTGVYLETDNGNIVSKGLTSGHNVHMHAGGGSIIDGNGDALNLLSTGNSSLWADDVIGSLPDPFDVNVGGKLFVGANGSNNGISIVINGTTGDNTLNPLNVPPGAVIFNGQYLFGNGPVREVLQRGVPYMLQDYRNLTNPLFTTAANTSGKLLKPGALTNTKAEIINKWQQPEPFDLRLIQSEDQSEAYELLMNH